VSKVDETTYCVNSLVIVEKKTGQLRLCIDPRDLNKNIKREHFHLPTKTEITAEMAGAKWFTKLDASNRFWQIELDKSKCQIMYIQYTIWTVLFQSTTVWNMLKS